jgi:hypothetical protein
MRFQDKIAIGLRATGATPPAAYSAAKAGGQPVDAVEALLFLASDQASSLPASCCRSTAASWPAVSDHPNTSRGIP